MDEERLRLEVARVSPIPVRNVSTASIATWRDSRRAGQRWATGKQGNVIGINCRTHFTWSVARDIVRELGQHQVKKKRAEYTALRDARSDGARIANGGAHADTKCAAAQEALEVREHQPANTEVTKCYHDRSVGQTVECAPDVEQHENAVLATELGFL